MGSTVIKMGEKVAVLFADEIIVLSKFEDVEYVELLLNPVDKCIAVRPCDRDNPNAIRWGRLKDSKWVVTSKSCSGFAGPLFNIMSWKVDCGYKLYGQFWEQNGDKLLVFDLSDPEITRFEEIEKEIVAVGENGEVLKDPATKESIVSTETVESKILIVPDFWDVPVRSNCNVSDYTCLKSEKYKNNWKIMSPAHIFRMSGNISEDTLNAIRQDSAVLLDELKAECKVAEG